MFKRILYLALAAALLYGVFTVVKKSCQLAPKATAVLNVTVVEPQPGSMADILSTTGVTVPREEIQVMSELYSVRVSEVLVEGDSVKKSQRLAVLDGEALANQRA